MISGNPNRYLVNYLGHFLRLIDSLKALGSIRPMEALGCSNIGHTLVHVSIETTEGDHGCLK